jgi:hypothetical protein
MSHQKDLFPMLKIDFSLIKEAAQLYHLITISLPGKFMLEVLDLVIQITRLPNFWDKLFKEPVLVSNLEIQLSKQRSTETKDTYSSSAELLKRQLVSCSLTE